VVCGAIAIAPYEWCSNYHCRIGGAIAIAPYEWCSNYHDKKVKKIPLDRKPSTYIFA